MRGFGLVTLVLGLVLVAAPTVAQLGPLVENGSFEDPAYAASTNFPVPVTGWTISPGAGFEVWRNFQGPAADGNQHLELDVFTCNTISQTIDTVAGTFYRIRFAFGARNGVADNRVEVLWNGEVVGTASANGVGQTQIAWTYHSVQVQATSTSSTLAFRNIDACDGQGSMLDDVSLNEVEVIPTLDPRGLAVLGVALALAAFVVLRRLG